MLYADAHADEPAFSNNVTLDGDFDLHPVVQLHVLRDLLQHTHLPVHVLHHLDVLVYLDRVIVELVLKTHQDLKTTTLLLKYAELQLRVVEVLLFYH